MSRLHFVGGLRVAIVSNDPRIRMAAARSFDGAPADWVIRLGADPEADVTVYGSDVERSAGLVFDPSCPARLIDEIHRTCADRHKRTIAVLGTGGGVGTTSITLHLAAFASAQQEVCVVDCDDRWRGAMRRVGLEPAAAPQLDPVPIELRALPCSGGFRVIAGDAGTVAPLTDLVEHFDRVILDLGTRMPPSECDSVVVVMPPTIHGAERARDLLHQLDGVPSALVSNRIGPGSELTVAKLVAVIGRSVSIELPVCAPLRDAEDHNRLLTTSWTRWARRVRMLAVAVDGASAR